MMPKTKTVWQWTLRLDEEQAALVRELSRRLSIRPPDVVRGSLDALSHRLPPDWNKRLEEAPPATRKELEQLRLSIDKVGRNVNQVSRLAHIAGSDDADELSVKLREIYARLDEIEGSVKETCRSLK